MIQQADVIGVGSLPIVILTGFFTGAVLALQSANSLTRFGALSFTGQLVSLSMVRELGPVLTGLMVAGRNASGMASELGSMKVTEQIDAMRALGTDPGKKLVTPRVISTMVMLFFLTIISDLVGLAGGSMVAVLLLRLDSNEYWNYAWRSLAMGDVCPGINEAGNLRLYHRQRRVLLRIERSRRHAGSGSRHHPGRSRRQRSHSCH